MHRVTPRVFLIGETQVLHDGLAAYLDSIGTVWKPFKTTPPSIPPSHPEQMIEVMGRLCYRSWEVGMNPNVTKVREGNDIYIANIVKSKHGSVLEHAVANFVIADCSRVFTHELVRHRAGTAFSQESLRYVRLEDLGLWLPPEVENDPHLRSLFERTFRDMEELQIEMAEHLKLDSKPFEEKKMWTSTMRRLAPHGLATTIGFSANMRALRHILEMRTAGSAEVEIRIIVDQIGKIAKERWPNVFADFTQNEKGEWVTEHSKV
jgi:thymidylate synthase (FAD)